MSTLAPTISEVDELVKRNRALTPKPAAEGRKVPRSSISELNELDIDEIRDRYVRHGYDDRSPITKVLDLIDLPRNVVGNLIFRSAGTPTEGLRKGALGLPVVTASDALKSLGVSNKVVRGVLGFIGDTATDPLTYAGPAGWGLKVMDDAGRAVGIGARGARGLKRGIKDVSRGTIPKDVPTKELFDALLANAPDEIKAADNARKAAYLSERALGKVGAETKAGKAFSYLSRSLGGDQVARGGAIASDLTSLTPTGEAVRKFVSRAGTAAGPGRGRGGSQIAHVPFTDISLKVPGFTRAGRAAEQDLAFARSATPRGGTDIATTAILRAAQLAPEIRNAVEAGIDASPLVTELATLVERTEAAPINPQSPLEIFTLKKYLDEAEAGMRAARAKMAPHQRLLSELGDDVDLMDEGSAEQVADSLHDTFKAYQRYRGAVTGAVRNFAQNTPQDEAMMQAAMRFLGTDDRIVGRAAFAGPDAMLKALRAPDFLDREARRAYRMKTTVFGEKGTALAEAARNLRHGLGPSRTRAINTYLAGVQDDLRKALEASGVKATGQDMEDVSALLMALVVRQQAARAGDGVFYSKRFGGEDPSEFLQVIERAIKGGKLSDKLNSGLMHRLEEVAAKHGVNLIDTLETIEVEKGLLQAGRRGYVPNVPTQGAREAIKRGKQYGEGVGQAAQRGVHESFQKPRSFDQVRWDGADGPKRMFRAEVDQAVKYANDPMALEALRREGYGDVADKLQEVVDDYAELRSLYPDEAAIPWHNTDPFEMNELAKDGRFSMLLDGENPVGGFMETNMLAAMANRVGQHERAMARASWREFVDKFALKAPEFKGASIGNKVVAADGSEAKIVTAFDSSGRPVKAAEIGGQVYRPVQGISDTPIAEMMGPESAATLYHEQVASAIERVAATQKEPHVVLDAVNTLTRQWKNITLLHPSWTIFNLIGDSWNAIVGGVNPANFARPDFAKFAAQVSRHANNPDKLRGITLNVRGQTVTGEQILADLIERKIIDGSMFEEQALKMVENKIFTMPSQRGGRFKPATLMSDAKDSAQRYAMARGRDGANRADKLRGWGSVVSDRYLNNFLGPWFRFNQKASNYVRTQTYLSFLEDGYSPGAAAAATIRSQFDYSDATRIEADLFRTLFPFYSWMRNNGAYQMKMMLERPGYAAAFPKLQTAIEEAIAGDEKVPMQMRPQWMRSALALQVGTDPEKRSALLFGQGLPVGDLYQYLTPILGAEGIMDFLHYFGSGVNPLLNVPLQLATGQETFSGRTIGADPYSGDISAGEFIRNQIRPLAEVGKVGRAFDQGGIGQAVGRAVLGGRVQAFDDERLRSSKLREFKDKERRYRAAITRAERTGDKGTSLSARVKLLELYSSMEEAGLGDDVPRWARSQVEQLQGS